LFGFAARERGGGAGYGLRFLVISGPGRLGGTGAGGGGEAAGADAAAAEEVS